MTVRQRASALLCFELRRSETAHYSIIQDVRGAVYVRVIRDVLIVIRQFASDLDNTFPETIRINGFVGHDGSLFNRPAHLEVGLQADENRAST
jgi:hypothetical protein